MRTLPTNREAAEVLFDVATILELSRDNPYRVQAYRRAARLLLTRKGDTRSNLTGSGELDMPGLGVRLRRKLGQLLTTGRISLSIDFLADMPAEYSPLLLIPGVGPRTALRLHEELGISSAADLVEAATAGKIRELYGFGAQRETLLLAGAREVLAGRPKHLAPFVPMEENDFTYPIPMRARPISVEQLELSQAA